MSGFARIGNYGFEKSFIATGPGGCSILRTDEMRGRFDNTREKLERLQLVEVSGLGGTISFQQTNKSKRVESPLGIHATETETKKVVISIVDRTNQFDLDLPIDSKEVTTCTERTIPRNRAQGFRSITSPISVALSSASPRSGNPSQPSSRASKESRPSSRSSQESRSTSRASQGSRPSSALSISMQSAQYNIGDNYLLNTIGEYKHKSFKLPHLNVGK